MKLVKYSAEWCQPCKQLEALLKRLEIDHEEINIDEKTEKALEANIRGVPTLVLMDDDNKEVARKVGALSEGTLLEWLNSHKFL